MNSIVYVLDVVIVALRMAFFGVAAILAVVAVVDWAARTRRINPFNPVARFMRSSVDPLMAPVERRVVRSGGLPSNAPWWSLAIVVLLGIVLLSVLNFVRNQLWLASGALQSGPTGIFRVLVAWTFGFLRIALVATVISSWFRISPYSKWVRWAFAITEPILRPLRQIIPPLGMIDVTPLVAYFLLWLVQSLLT
jgi:YggT family protein